MPRRLPMYGFQWGAGMSAEVDEKLTEFKDFIWNHSVDAFQLQFDERRDLSESEVAFLTKLAVVALKKPEAAAGMLGAAARRDSDLLALVLQICGLTRNKILQDLKASATPDSPSVPGSYKTLARGPIWELAGAYIVERLRKVVRSFASASSESICAAMQSLNQATWPGYIRQERAKRSGHEAEYRLATLFQQCKLPFEPLLKAENPLSPDAQIHSVSFDLVSPNVSAPALVVKATVHTANIGQFGESKDHLEISEARAMIDARFTSGRPTLVAFIDGVGFYSNSAGLRGVLEKSDEFCQFRTIWKAVVIAQTRLNSGGCVLLPRHQIERFAEFFKRWNALDRIAPLEQAQLTGEEIEAGDALIVLQH